MFRLLLTRTPPPPLSISGRTPEASPPWAPYPGERNRASGSNSLTLRPISGRVTPTTAPARVPPAGLLEKRKHRILPHVRVDGDAGCAIDAEMRPGVSGGHGADVPALYVRYGRQAQIRGSLDQVSVDSHPDGT